MRPFEVGDIVIRVVANPFAGTGGRRNKNNAFVNVGDVCVIENVEYGDTRMNVRRLSDGVRRDPMISHFVLATPLHILCLT